MYVTNYGYCNTADEVKGVIILQQLYVAYDPSPPHLPIAVADTQKDLAAMLGIQAGSICKYLYRLKEGQSGDEKYRAVCVDEYRREEYANA